MVRALRDITGQRFNRWTVERLEETSGKVKYWHCVCDCGTRRLVKGTQLTCGQIKSCGCHKLEGPHPLWKHGMCDHPIYKAWKHARARCRNKRLPEYKDYGGRGIQFCWRWEGFNQFYADMSPTWKPGLTLERKDVDGDYEPSNCTWATRLEQTRNRRLTKWVDTDHGRMTVYDAALHYGFKPVTIYKRVRSGWPDAVLFTPVPSDRRAK